MKKVLAGAISALFLLGITGVVQAATLHATASGELTQASPNFSSGVIDASGHENLTFSFSYEAEELDDGDSFKYGWKSGGVENDIATVDGANEGGPAGDETGTVNAPLPIGAQVADLEVYIRVTADAGADEVNLTSISVAGDEVGPVPTLATEEFVTVDGSYKGVSVGFRIENVENAVVTGVTVTMNRASGGPVVKTSGPGVMSLIDGATGTLQLTTPFVIQEGTFTEAGDVDGDGNLYWNPAPANWDESTRPVSVTIEVITESGTLSATNNTFSDGEPSWPTYESILPPVASIGDVDYGTLGEAIAAVSEGSTVTLNRDVYTGAQVTITTPLTLEGNGHTIYASFEKVDLVSPNDNNSAIGVIDADNVTINNLVIDGTGGTNLHGVNVYVSDNVTLDGVTISGFRAAVVVNGSGVTVNDITTSGNSWGGINVDLGSGVTSPAVLTVNGDSTHTETGPDIWMDNITKPVSLVDTNQQYASTTVGNLRTYKLDTEAPVITLNGDAQVTVFRTNGYVDEGATAIDNVNSSVVVTDDSDSFNFNEVGTYTITYTATDTSGNTSTLTRTVIVRPTSSGGGRGNSAGAASSQAAQAVANAGVTLPSQAAVVIGGEVLGASTVDLSAFVGQVLGANDVSVTILSTQALSSLTTQEKEAHAAQTKTVLAAKITELIGILQSQLSAALAAQGL